MQECTQEALPTRVCYQGPYGPVYRSIMAIWPCIPVYNGHMALYWPQDAIWPYTGLRTLYGPGYGLRSAIWPWVRSEVGHMALYTGLQEAIWPCTRVYRRPYEAI